jgi:DNA-binding NarL/FixJ family response regulator
MKENTMILLVTYRVGLREQLETLLQAKGHMTCIPPHRQDLITVMEEYHPDLIVLDLYLSNPSGLDVLKAVRSDGYEGPVVMLSGVSMTSVIHDALPLGVEKVVHVPEEIGGRFLLGELEFAIETMLNGKIQPEKKPYRGQIAKRAHALYEQRGRQHGHDIQDWLRAEQEFVV